MNTIDPVIKLGPHMFDEECHCESCAGWRAKRDAGMHIDIDTVRKEAELCIERAVDEVRHGKTPPMGYRHAVDPIMRIPCSVVLALCDVYGGPATRKEYVEALAENAALRDAVPKLRSKIEDCEMPGDNEPFPVGGSIDLMADWCRDILDNFQPSDDVPQEGGIVTKGSVRALVTEVLRDVAKRK